MAPLGGAVKYDTMDFIFAARATVQTGTRAVVSVTNVYIFLTQLVFNNFLQRGASMNG